MNRHQPHCAMGKGGDCCTCDLTLPAIEDMREAHVKAATDYLARRCQEDQCNLDKRDRHAIITLLGAFGMTAGVEGLRKDLADAESLLKRGKKCLGRLGWEKGESDSEWIAAVSSFLGYLRNQREYEQNVTTNETASS